jgi:LuxR family transcriptional regulator, maltose regulon positive regulatory protein
MQPTEVLRYSEGRSRPVCRCIIKLPMTEPSLRRDRTPDLIISAKLVEPPLRPGFLFRSRLIEKLNQGINRHLTLVSAPAGFGKTSLILSWVKNTSHPCAWVSLDPHDNNPARFFTYLAEAVTRTKEGKVNFINSALNSQGLHSAMDMALVFLHEISNWNPFTLIVLDDFHYITDPDIQEALGFIIQNMPNRQEGDIKTCSGCHIVIISRNDPGFPLSRWRLNGDISEVRTSDLRFTLPEATEVLRYLDQIHLSDENIRLVVEKTEGWAASMQLISLYLAGVNINESTKSIQTLTGKNPFISDYFAEEVFSQNDDQIKSFLLQTSVLERFSGKLCDFVTGMNNSREKLELLEKKNLFLIPMDDKREWYRYHSLFGDFLQNKLENDPAYSMETIHSKAAEWYEQNGFIEDSLKHWMMIKRFDEAARVVTKASPGILSWGQFYILKNVIEAFPDEAFQVWPWLSIYRAWAYFILEPEEVEIWLQNADMVITGKKIRDDYNDSEIISMQGDIAAIRALCASRKGDIQGILENAPLALEFLSEQNKRVRGLVLYAIASEQYIGFRLDDAIQSSIDAKDTLIQGGNFGGATESLTMIGEIQQIQGKLHSAYQTYQSVIDLEKNHQREGIGVACTAWSGLGEVLFEWNRTDEALEALMKGCTGSKKMGLAERLTCDLALANGWLSLGQIEQAELLIKDHYLHISKEHPLSRFVDQIRDCWIRILIARGDQREARLLLRQEGGLSQVSADPRRELSLISIAGAFYRLGEYDHCMDIATNILASALSGGRMGLAIKSLGLLSGCSVELGSVQDAMRYAQRMIKLCLPEGYQRTFLDLADQMKKALGLLLKSDLLETNSVEEDFVKDLLDFFPDYMSKADQSFTNQKGGKRPPAEIVEISPIIITEHEKKVLRMLLAGQDNKAISCELCISINTVKTHLKNIYAKLKVHNRFQAAVRVSELKIKL